MIVSFADKSTAKVFEGQYAPKLPQDISRRALKSLLQIHAARNLDDLRVPPGNKLEALQGNLKGFYSIRINNQWRVMFEFKAGNASKVQIIDYHI